MIIKGIVIAGITVNQLFSDIPPSFFASKLNPNLSIHHIKVEEASTLTSIKNICSQLFTSFMDIT